jgi:hypothetical protein
VTSHQIPFGRTIIILGALGLALLLAGVLGAAISWVKDGEPPGWPMIPIALSLVVRLVLWRISTISERRSRMLE